MDNTEKQIDQILGQDEHRPLRIETLGYFQVELGGNVIPDSDWKRDIAIQLFQYLITIRNQRALHKTQIIDRLWGDMNEEAGNRNFKTALHHLTKVIEPNRTDRSPSQVVIRQGLSYRLDENLLWIDIDALDKLIALGDEVINDNPVLAALAYEKAVELYKGEYLPNRIYQDWSVEERERVQIMILDAMMTLAKLKLKDNPKQSIRLAQKTLKIDATWEEAYRILMEAHMEEGNRPLAVKAYQKCKQVLEKEFDIEPLPETNLLFRKIRGN